jgi:hypothetical protein
MKAVRFDMFGGPEVLHLVDVKQAGKVLLNVKRSDLRLHRSSPSLT